MTREETNMFLDNYYDDIMDTDVTDFSRCTNKVALYNKRVQDVKRYLGIVNTFVAHHKEERKKDEDVINRWKHKMEQYYEIGKKAAEAGNGLDEIKAKRAYADISYKLALFEGGLEYHDSQLALLEKAHKKLLEDAEKLKAMESTIANEYTGTPKTVSSNQNEEIIEEKKEPKFTVFTNVVIND